jgi:RNA polymerase sigma-70 factor (ECF subfamily)
VNAKEQQQQQRMTGQASVSDEELAAMAADGVAGAFDELVARHGPSVFRLGLAITGVHQDAEDIVQETFMRAYRHIDSFRPQRGSFKTWVLTIARNQSRNAFAAIKRKATRLFSETYEDSYDPPPDNDLFNRPQLDSERLLQLQQDMQGVHSALRRLPERQRTALLLKAQDELSYAEIAEVMGVSASSVESLIFRARKKLTDQLA